MNWKDRTWWSVNGILGNGIIEGVQLLLTETFRMWHESELLSKGVWQDHRSREDRGTGV